MTEVILHSDNVGMVFVAKKLGKSKLLEYLRRFGFGRLTNIDLQEESLRFSGRIINGRRWIGEPPLFGQGIAVTRLQW